MELSRGICILCTASTKVVLPPEAESITNLLCEMLKNHIDVQKFTETISTLKVCPLCLHDILQVSEHEKKVDELSENIDTCSMCRGTEHLVLVTEWAHFNKLIENLGSQRRKKCTICLRCIKYLDLFNRIKMNFLKKYPHLELTEALKDKIKYNKMKSINNNTHFEGELLTDSKKASNNLNVALKHLQPLTCTPLNVEEYKGDIKLLKQVAYVKLDYSPIRSSQSRHSIKKSTKQNSSVLNDSASSTETSPKPSFFKIRLKLNPNKSSKSYKVMTGKVSKPKSKLSLSKNKKELIVKVLKMDLDEVKRRNSSDSSEDELSNRTPTKASRKMLPEHSSSSKKRKSVTFAEDLNVEIIDGVRSRKNTAEGTPLKSSLKKSSSPTAELFKNGSAEHSSEEDIDSVNNIRIDDSEDELDASESYVEEIRKNNDSIFDHLKIFDDSESLPCKRKDGSDDENEPEENDSKLNKRNNKNRRPSFEIQNDTECDDEHEDESLILQEKDNGTPKSKKTNKRKRTENSDSESGVSETEESAETQSDKINNDKNSAKGYKEEEEDRTNKNKRRKSCEDPKNSETITIHEAQNNEQTEHDVHSSEKLNETITKPEKLISQLDSAISVSSDSSKEDRMLTLDQYKKIRKSIDEINRSDDSGKNDSITSSSEDVLLEEPENEEVTLAKNDDDGKPETNKDKVSDDESNQSDTQSQNVHEHSPEAPADDVITEEPIVDNDNTVSDAESSGLAGEDTEQQQLAESSEKTKVTPEDSSSVACVTTDDAGGVLSSVDGKKELTHRNGDNVSPADEPDLDPSDTIVSEKSCSSDSYVTATDGDKLSDSPVK